jgi:hypothetical protein
MKTIKPRDCVHRLKISVKKSPTQLPLCIALINLNLSVLILLYVLYHKKTHYKSLFCQGCAYISLLIQNS